MISRSLLPVMLLAAPALAGPPLTTIQDLLYKADGSKFSGTLTINWNSFQAVDHSAIVTQIKTLKVTDGNLRVQLVPTTTATPATFYTVIYNSDGRVQFQETWAVPSSATPLRVQDVRIATPPSSGGGGTGGGPAGDTGGSTPAQETDIVGLITDLGARPLKGPGYAAGRVAVVNSDGALEGATGASTDCIRVDGSSTPCGGLASAFVDGESPGGIVDGANAQFSLSSAPEPVSSVSIFRNGLLQKPGVDYTLSGRNVVFVSGGVPQPGDTLIATYRLSGTDVNPAQIYPNPQVLCAGTGAGTNSDTMGSIGSCAIAAGVLSPGDRVLVHFDLEHAGTASTFNFEVHWGASTVLQRSGAVSDVLATGRADIGLTGTGAQIGTQSWGTVLPLAVTIVAVTDAYNSGITIDFQGSLSAAGGDTLTLKNYTVVRYP